jgi:hypothetical protein
MQIVYVLQYLSVDRNWYDQTGLVIDDLAAATALYDSLAVTRGAEWKAKHRIIARVDTVVYPSDPASQFGA